jgi:hypothetical protein
VEFVGDGSFGLLFGMPSLFARTCLTVHPQWPSIDHRLINLYLTHNNSSSKQPPNRQTAKPPNSQPAKQPNSQNLTEETLTK